MYIGFVADVQVHTTNRHSQGEPGGVRGTTSLTAALHWTGLEHDDTAQPAGTGTV
jgi:hypothetical protein